MDTAKAKAEVIKAGRLLCEKGLIQRTWGNVSCRIDDSRFAITPSGRDYLSLTPEDIVVVNISDLQYEGDIKPSSEKGIHAACYRLRKDVNFVIHTHQTFASIVGITGYDINHLSGEAAQIIGPHIPLALYGLPGTKKIKNNVSNALERSQSKAVLMQHHGALCTGESLEDAFNVASALEDVCREQLLGRYKELTGKTIDSFSSLSSYIANRLMDKTCADELEAFDSQRIFGTLEMTPSDGGDSVLIDIASGKPLDPSAECPDTAELHSRIYQTRKDVNSIVHSKEDSTLEMSKTGLTVKPFLDDFAQIVGLSLKNADYNPNNAMRSAKAAVKKLRHRDAVMLRHNGAVCVGSSSDEAQAVKLVTEKGCAAAVSAFAYGQESKHINVVECALMRFIYKHKYSKKKN